MLVQQLVNRFKELKAETLAKVKSEAEVDTVADRLAEVEVETPSQHTAVSVKMVGTLWGLLVPSMLVYKIW